MVTSTSLRKQLVDNPTSKPVTRTETLNTIGNLPASQDDKSIQLMIIDDEYHEKYKASKRRWVMLSFALINELLNCLERLMLPINTLIYSHWGTNVDQVAGWSLLSLTLMALGTLPLGRALDKLGIKRMARYQAVSMVIGQLLLASTFLDDQSPFGLRQSLRFPTFIISSSILVINLISISGLNAKVANDWFPLRQTTLAIVVPGIAYNLFGAIASILAPMLIKSADDLNIMAYIYASSAIIYPLAAFTLIRTSKPKNPPSHLAVIASESLNIDLRVGLMKVAKSPRIIIGMLANNAILCSYIIQQKLLNDILTSRQFDNDFCGLLIGVGCSIGVIGSLLAAWLDMKSTSGANFFAGHSVKVSRFAALFYTLAYLTFNCSLLGSTSPTLIMFAMIIWSIALGLVLPLQLQQILRESKGMLPDASMVAINSLVQTFGYWLITGLYLFSKNILNDKIAWFESCVYIAPLLSFCCLILLVNGLYFVVLDGGSSSKQTPTLIESDSMATSSPMESTKADQTNLER